MSYELPLSLSLNRLFLLNPPLEKGDIGGFSSGCLERIPPHPPEAVKKFKDWEIGKPNREKLPSPG
jgi:hypothetical protein